MLHRLEAMRKLPLLGGRIAVRQKLESAPYRETVILSLDVLSAAVVGIRLGAPQSRPAGCGSCATPAECRISSA